ncbi:MAG: sigma 54-interacting transcriptional regulator [bacterium]
MKKSNKTESMHLKGEARFRKIFDYSNDAIFIMDPEGDKIIDANQKACEMLEYSHDELLLKSTSAIHPHEVNALIAFSRSVLKKGHGWTSELSCMTKSGLTLPSEISASTIEINGLTCVIAMIRDITARKKAEAALRESENRINRILLKKSEASLERVRQQNELILQAAGEGIYGLDTKGNTTFVNPAAAALIGWDPAELIGLSQHDILHHSKPDGTPYSRLSCPIYAAFSDGKIHYVENEVFWRKDGSSFPVEYTSTPIRKNGALVGAVVVFKDITERKQSEAALRKALEEIERLKNRLQAENIYLREEIQTEKNFEEIIGQSQDLIKVLRKAEQVAPTDASVVLQGETGTGKELIARAIHNLSTRKERPLVKMNCGAIPQGLLDSELFGHEKGAFTGAIQKRIGRFELADGGTIFLDEIAELPSEAQVRLLRILQEHEFERVGSSQAVKVDVRIIAATNRNLEDLSKKGIFRSDLYYRLNVVPLELPPLRERKSDIQPLVNCFLAKFAKKMGKPVPDISTETLSKLTNYPWPGNIRELENVIERTVILSQGPTITIDDAFEAQIDANRSGPTTTPTNKSLEAFERDHILRVLKETEFVIDGKRGAAAILEIHPNTLRFRMKKLGIQRPQ